LLPEVLSTLHDARVLNDEALADSLLLLHLHRGLRNLVSIRRVILGIRSLHHEVVHRAWCGRLLNIGELDGLAGLIALRILELIFGFRPGRLVLTKFHL